MKYVLTPTDDDILHYKKGSESKSHSYISRVFQKGRWVYTYAKNRARGNKVTNKTKGTTSYTPNEKTKRTITNQTKDVIQYNPTVKTLDIGRDMGGRLTNVFNGHNISKAMAENMTAETKTDGLTYFANIMNTARTETVTNRTKDVKQYTPNYKTNVNKQYSPTIKTETWDSHKWKNGDITEFKEAREYNAKLGKTTPLRNAHRSYENINRHSDDYDEALKRHKSRKKN